MNRALGFTLASTLALVALAGCSSSENGEATSGDGGGDAASSTGTSTGDGGHTSSNPDAIKLTMTPFEVGPGEEVYRCQNFANPFGDRSDIKAIESHMSQGSHHLLLFYTETSGDAPIEPCSGLEFAPTPYGSQQPDDAVTLPDGVGIGFPAPYGMRVQAHYLNTTSVAITANVEIDFTQAEVGEVTQHAGVLFMPDININVPPHGSQVVARDCKVPFDMNIVQASSHMHRHATNFESTVGGAPFYATTAWSDPMPAKFSPVLALKANDPIHYACTFQNDGDVALTFGESALTNEMCILTALFYPVSGTNVTPDCAN